MAENVRILNTERDDDDGIIVTFSDGTTGGYVVEELLALRPIRERVRTEPIKTPQKWSGKPRD